MEVHTEATSPDPDENTWRHESSKPRPTRNPPTVKPTFSPGKYAPPNPTARVERMRRLSANVSVGSVNWMAWGEDDHKAFPPTNPPETVKTSRDWSCVGPVPPVSWAAAMRGALMTPANAAAMERSQRIRIRPSCIDDQPQD